MPLYDEQDCCKVEHAECIPTGHMRTTSHMTRRPTGTLSRLSAFTYGLCLSGLACMIALASPSHAQSIVPPPGSRAALEAELRVQDSLANAGVASARARAAHLRQRLTEGDFRVGDRILIVIQNSPDYPANIVEAFSDTLVVSEARTIAVPQAGVVQLNGLLRPELDSTLSNALARVFVTPPRIITRVTIPITVSGQVGSQGFHSVTPTIRIADLIQSVGPTGSADVNRIVVKRSGREIISADSLRTEIARGATLDQLNMQAGDEIFVAERKPPFRWTSIIGIASAVLGLVWAIDRVRR
jgi:protein involved in polysaccharide export with SLBB domain